MNLESERTMLSSLLRRTTNNQLGSVLHRALLLSSSPMMMIFFFLSLPNASALSSPFLRGRRSISTTKDDKDKERRRKAEEIAERDVNKWSSPLFTHVEVDVETHKNRTFSRAENSIFLLLVFCLVAYFGKFAMQSSKKKEEKKRVLKEKREKRALEAFRREKKGGFGALRRNGGGGGDTGASSSRLRPPSEDEDDDDDDPFEGLTPDEIVQLKESVERELS